jgi:hypothetical protein
MPKAKHPKNCYRCEAMDRVRRTFMTCQSCGRYFCSEHGSVDLDQCENCLEAGEEVD